MSIQLVIKANAKKEKKLWKEIVSSEYHEFVYVLEEEELEKFPDSQPWDHAIDLIEGALKSLDCWVYPLAPKEKEGQAKFL